jgi:hypothetical protein
LARRLAPAPHYRSRANEKAEPQPAPAESPAESKAVFGVQIRKTLGRTKGEEQMSEDYGEQMRLWHEGNITARPIRIVTMHDKDAQILQLIRERDEARAGNHQANEYEPTWAQLVDYWKQRATEAEARGYRKGVEDAAKVVEVTADKFSSERTIRTILALLEPDTLQKPEA